MNLIKYLTLTMLSAGMLIACGGNGASSGEGKKLARVGSKYLYEGDIRGLVQGASEEDSIYRVRVYMDKWVEDQLMLEKAEEVIPNNAEIDRLVEDYRASLIRNEYEQYLVKNELDTLVAADAVKAYYDANLEQYQTGAEWVRCYFVKLPRSLSGTEEARTWFKNRTNSEELGKFCKENGLLFILDETIWVRADKIAGEMPDYSIPNRYLTGDGTLDKSDDDYYYLFRSVEFRDSDEGPPIAQVKDQIIQSILHERRLNLIDELTKATYHEGKNSGKVEIY